MTKYRGADLMVKSNEALEQQLEDLGKEIFKRLDRIEYNKLDRIEKKQDITNGRVNKSEKRIEIQEDRYENCIARNKQSVESKGLRWDKVSVMLSSLVVVLLIIQFLAERGII